MFKEKLLYRATTRHCLMNYMPPGIEQKPQKNKFIHQKHFGKKFYGQITIQR